MTDIIDRAQALEEAERETAIHRQALARLAAGPERIDCTDCGDPIPIRRRQALPTARRCIHCQKTSERKRT